MTQAHYRGPVSYTHLSQQTHILFHLTITLGPQLAVWAVSLSTTGLISRSLTPGHLLYGILSLIGFGNLVRPLAHSVLYLHQNNPRLALKLFRGEPAISEFVWNFSATHSLSLIHIQMCIRDRVYSFCLLQRVLGSACLAMYSSGRP